MKVIIVSFSLMLLFVACTDDSISPIINEDIDQGPELKEIEFSTYHIAGCKSDGLAKAVADDSCFVYSFGDTLKVNFYLWGNCCPDSQRFVTTYNISSDTIFIAVQDTAIDGCYCNCNYAVHLELSELPEDTYLFYFDYPGMYFSDSLKYREQVIRN